MGKNAKNKEKKKSTNSTSKSASLKKNKTAEKPVKKAGKSSSPKSGQKELQQQGEALRKEQQALAAQYQAMVTQSARLEEDISRLRMKSQEVSGRLAAEIESAARIHDRLHGLESREGVDQEQLGILGRQIKKQLNLVEGFRDRLGAVEQLASSGGQLGDQVASMQAVNRSLESRIDTLLMETAELRSGNGDIGLSVDSLSTRLEESIERLEANLQREQAVESRVESLVQADNDFSLRVDQQQERIQELLKWAEELDQTEHKITKSLQHQIGDLRAGLATTEGRMADKNAELERKALHLDSEYQSLADKQGSLSGRVVVAGVLLLLVGGIAYWLNFSQMQQTTIDFSRQIEQVSVRMDQQEKNLLEQEKRFVALETTTGKDQSAEWEELEQRQQQTDRQLAELTSLQAEWHAVMEQQGEKLLSIEQQLQEVQAPARVDETPVANDSNRNSGWLLGLNPKHYTIQIFSAYDAELVSRVAARGDLPEVLATYQRDLEQRDWHVLLYGEFSTLGEAELAMQGLPGDIRRYGPWIRRMSAVQRDLAERQ